MRGRSTGLYRKPPVCLSLPPNLPPIQDSGEITGYSCERQVNTPNCCFIDVDIFWNLPGVPPNAPIGISTTLPNTLTPGNGNNLTTSFVQITVPQVYKIVPVVPTYQGETFSAVWVGTC